MFRLDVKDGIPGDAREAHRGPRLRPAPLLLLALRPVPLADLVARRHASCIVVSNRGRISGSGGLWRMRAEPGAPTARGPGRGDDLEGSSRLGARRPARRLRVLPGAAVAPALARARRRAATRSRSPTASSTRRRRASRPTARRIAYVSNEDGAPALWTIRVPGGERRQGRDPRAAAARGHRPAARRRDRERPLRAGADLGHDARTAAASCPRARGVTPTTTSTARSAGSSTATSTPQAAPRPEVPAGAGDARGHARARVPAGAPHARGGRGRDAPRERRARARSPTGRRAGGGAATCTCT